MNCNTTFFKTIFTILALFLVVSLRAQEIKVPVEINLPVETEKFDRLISNDSDLFFLQKRSSKEITLKKINLVNYDYNLSQKWVKEISINQFENPLSFNASLENLNLITVEHDLDEMTSTVLRRYYSQTSGIEIGVDTLLSYEIGNWLNAYGKASVAQTFESAVNARQATNEATPLEYSFTLDYSLDSSKIIIYQYDNSQDKLVVRGAVFNEQFELINRFNVGIDDAHICYGLKVDNNGEIYLLKISNRGKLAVLNVNLETDQEKYLTLPEGSTTKVNPRLYIHKSHEVYLVYCNTKKDHLQSVSLAILNFETEEVDDQHVYKLDSEFLHSLNDRIKNGDKYFELAEIEEIDNHLVVILEQHQIEGADIHYHPNDVESLAHWESGDAVITTGNALILVFNKELDAQGKFVIKKNQKGNITDGMNTLSHKVFKTNGGLKFLYSNRTKGLTNNEFHHSYLDIKQMKLKDATVNSHSLGMVPVLTSTAFTPDGSVIFLTRKGLLGRKNYLNKWHYSSH